MKFDSFLRMLGDQSFFDLATAVQLSGEPRGKLCTQLYRWARAGKLLLLRRGMYAWAAPYCRAPLHSAQLANHLYHPSYLSGLWALGFYGMIPERVVTYTSVTTRVPRHFENASGIFDYRHVKKSAFFGYHGVEMQGERILMARPEKALLDFWYLEKGPWTAARVSAMRFQNGDVVDMNRLSDYANRFASPRLKRVVDVWTAVSREVLNGVVEL